MSNPYWRVIRPTHWLKNGLVFAALVFSFSFNSVAVGQAALAFVSFCLLASSIYVINDLADAERDRHHPDKKSRPIAAGEISPSQAVGLIVGLLVLAGLAFIQIGGQVWIIGLIYLIINLLYSLGLKHIAILDVIIVSLGFLLRVIAGALAIGVGLSDWIILCSFFLALFVTFGKRKNEMAVLADMKDHHRRSMREYTDQFIDQMLSLSATTSVVFYALYTIDSRTIQHFHGRSLIYTTPIVVFGILRYYHLLYNRGQGGDPVKLFAKDRAILAAIIVWIAAVLLIYYLPV